MLLAVGVVWPSAALRAAAPAWSVAETIALTASGVAVEGLALAMNSGRAAAIWLESNTTVRAAFRPAGGPFGSSQTLDTQTVVRNPSIAVGPDGQAIGVWAGTNPARTVAVADLAAAATTFGSATTIFTSSTAQDPSNTNVNIDATGATLIVFRGDGTSGYSRIWSAERAAGVSGFSVTSRTGNFEVGGLRMGADTSAAAYAYAWGIVAGANHMIIGPRRKADRTWVAESFASPYCCGTIAQGPGSVVVDGSDNGYFTVDVGSNGAVGPNFVRVKSDGTAPQGAINPDAAAFSSPVGESAPKVVVDAAGNAVMAWIRPDSSLYAAYRAAGDATSFGTVELIGPISALAASRYGLAMDASGNAIIVWKDTCAAGACTLKSKVRARGAATTFGNQLTVSANVRDDSALAIARDGANSVGVIWRDSTSPINLKASFINVAAAEHLAITSSTADLTSGSNRTLTAEIHDFFGNVVTGDSATSVTFAKTDGTGSLTGLGAATAASGVASKTVTGNQVGSVTVTASASGLTSATTTFTVVVGAANRVVITSATTALGSGAGRTLTAEIRDANGNVRTGDNTTVVTFSQTDGTGSVTGLGDATASSGIASKVITGSQLGSVTITAAASSLTSGTATFAVVAGAANRLVFTSATSNLASGVARTLTAEIRDVNGNVLTGDNTTEVTFTQTGGSGSATGLGAATAVAGIASKTVTGNQPGSLTITASVSGLTSGTTTFTIVVGAANQLVFTSATTTLASGVARTLTAEIRDVNGNVVTSDSTTTVTFAQTGGTGSITGLGNATAAAGVASNAITGNLVGSVTITASVSGLSSGTTTFTVVTGAANHLAFTSATAPLLSGTSRVLSVEIRDVNGNVRSDDQSTVVTFAQTSGTGTLTGLGASTASSGVASRTGTGGTTGSVTVTASASGLTSATTTITVTGQPVFTDNSLSVAISVKAVHVTELRDAIAILRARYSLSVPTWTDPTIVAGVTPVKRIHVIELRTALDQVYAAAARTAPTYTDATLTASTSIIRAIHIVELRQAVLALW